MSAAFFVAESLFYDDLMSSLAPLCFVLMPFGKKTDANGLTIDFDAVYGDIIKPAITAAGLEPLRADEEQTGGIIHKPMFERLILCPFAVADLTTANANVFYELGVRHAVRPASTVLLFAEGGRLPFDVAKMRALPYRLGPDGKPSNAKDALELLRKFLVEAKKSSPKDSPLYHMVEDYPNVQHEKTDVFREQVNYSRKQKAQLAEARKSKGALTELTAFEQSLGDLANVESGVLIDLFLSYRSAKGWEQMIALAERMPDPLKLTVMVQEQLALALNRAGRDDEAEKVLQAVLASRGPSSETHGLLGRVYKDRYDRAQQAKETFRARGELKKAIDAYLTGFETDWRDAYPGINAVTLMELREPPDPRQQELLPLVKYAAQRKIARGAGDYWDYATLLEAAVLARNEQDGYAALEQALAAIREVWEPETTARNLKLIRDVRAGRGEEPPEWVQTAIAELDARSK